MNQFVEFIYSGLVLGAVYATMAVGLSLVWGGLRMLNMAHGAMLMVGAYAGYFASSTLGLNPVLALFFAVIVTALAGAAMYPLLVRPLIGKEGWDIAVIVATVALSVALSRAMQLLFGPQTHSLPPIVDGGFRGPARVTIEYQTLVIAAAALATLACVAAFLRYTRLGLSVRAVAQNLDAARFNGLAIGRINALVLAVGAALAALSGVLLASQFVFITPSMSAEPQLVAIIIIILGGLGSVKGTVYAAFIAGLVQSGAQSYLAARWSLPLLFAVVIVLLLVRPQGLFGRAVRTA